MKARFSPDFYRQYKKVNVRIQKAIDEKIRIFEKDEFSSELNNHKLRGEYEGYNSINITNDYRAIYEEVVTPKRTIAYFILLGTHKELYG